MLNGLNIKVTQAFGPNESFNKERHSNHTRNKRGPRTLQGFGQSTGALPGDYRCMYNGDSNNSQPGKAVRRKMASH